MLQYLLDSKPVEALNRIENIAQVHWIEYTIMRHLTGGQEVCQLSVQLHISLFCDMSHHWTGGNVVGVQHFSV